MKVIESYMDDDNKNAVNYRDNDKLYTKMGIKLLLLMMVLMTIYHSASLYSLTHHESISCSDVLGISFVRYSTLRKFLL